jgi:hypothetical protein
MNSSRRGIYSSLAGARSRGTQERRVGRMKMESGKLVDSCMAGITANNMSSPEV